MSVTYPELEDIFITDTFNAWRIKTITIKNHATYIEELFGDWSSLRTDVKDNMVLSINEMYEYVYQNDLKIQQLNTKQDNAFTYIGLSIDGDYESGITRFYGISNNIKNDINLIDSRLHQVDVFLQNLNNKYVGTVDYIKTMVDNIGLDDDGVYTSDHWGTNAYAITDNIGNDIHDLDFNLKSLNNRHDRESTILQLYINKVEKYSFDLNDRHINTLSHIDTMHNNIGLDDSGKYISDVDNTYAKGNVIGKDIYNLDVKLKSLNDRHDTESTYVYTKIAQVEKYSFDLNDRHINTLSHIDTMHNNIGLDDSGKYISDVDNTYAKENVIGKDIHNLDFKLKSLNDRHDTESTYVYNKIAQVEKYSFDLNDRHINTLSHISVIRDNIGLDDSGKYISDSGNTYAKENVIKDDIHRIDEKLKTFSDEYQITVDEVYQTKFIDLFSTRQGDRDYISDIETRLTATQTSLGFSENGGYTSHPLNESAIHNNVKSDITSLDDKIQNVKDDITAIIQTHHHDVNWSNVSNKPDISGTIWAQIVANTFRSGTTMLFYQNYVPNGWTLVSKTYDEDNNTKTPFHSIVQVTSMERAGLTIGDMGSHVIFNHTHPHTFQVNGSTDGHALTVDELPSHYHRTDVWGGQAGGHSHGVSLATNSAGSHIHKIYANNRGSYSSQIDGLGAFKDDAERLLADWQDTIRPAGDHSHSVSGNTNNAGGHSHSFTATGHNTGSGYSHNHSMYVGLTGSVSSTAIIPKYSNMILCRRS